MPLILLVLLLAFILGGVGFVVHALWIAAIVIAVVWLVGFVARPHGGRWYRW